METKERQRRDPFSAAARSFQFNLPGRQVSAQDEEQTLNQLRPTASKRQRYSKILTPTGVWNYFLVLPHGDAILEMAVNESNFG